MGPRHRGDTGSPSGPSTGMTSLRALVSAAALQPGRAGCALRLRSAGAKTSRSQLDSTRAHAALRLRSRCTEQHGATRASRPPASRRGPSHGAPATSAPARGRMQRDRGTGLMPGPRTPVPLYRWPRSAGHKSQGAPSPAAAPQIAQHAPRARSDPVRPAPRSHPLASPSARPSSRSHASPALCAGLSMIWTTSPRPPDFSPPSSMHPPSSAPCF